MLSPDFESAHPLFTQPKALPEDLNITLSCLWVLMAFFANKLSWNFLGKSRKPSDFHLNVSFQPYLLLVFIDSLFSEHIEIFPAPQISLFAYLCFSFKPTNQFLNVFTFAGQHNQCPHFFPLSAAFSSLFCKYSFTCFYFSVLGLEFLECGVFLLVLFIYFVLLRFSTNP